MNDSNVRMNDSHEVHPEYEGMDDDISFDWSYYNEREIWKLTFLSTLLIIGIPMNTYGTVIAITHLRKEVTRILLLQLNSCIAGLLLLLSVALPTLCLIPTFEFGGGNALCKLMRFASISSLLHFNCHKLMLFGVHPSSVLDGGTGNHDQNEY